MKDNPCLYLRTLEATSMDRVLNIECVYGFFDKYESILDEYKFTANQMYNIDEISLSTFHKPKIIAQKPNINLGHLQVVKEI